MFAGHYAASFVAKRLDERIPLWILFMAAQFVDVLWGLFILTGIEKLRIIPHFTQSNALDLYYMPYTHGLISSLFWGGATYWLVSRTNLAGASDRRRPALLIAAVVFSHFLLDLIVHVPDLPLVGDSVKVGFGLWNNLPATLALENGLLVVSIAYYLMGTPQLPRARKLATVAFGVLLLLINLGNYLGPGPSNPQAMAMSALGAYLLLGGLALAIERLQPGKRAYGVE